jgi:valyl-tRNA synthetase
MADNYLEMAKQRLYGGSPGVEAAVYALYHALHTLLHLLAPLLPYVTEAIFQGLWPDGASIHRSAWPAPNAALLDGEAEQRGELLVEIASAVRRYKSEAGLSLASEITCLYLCCMDELLLASLREGVADLASVTRARVVIAGAILEPGLTTVWSNGSLTVALRPASQGGPAGF